MILDIIICSLSKEKFVQIFKNIILIISIAYSYEGELITFPIENSQNINKILSDRLSVDKNPTGYFKLENINQKTRHIEYRKYYIRNSVDTLIIKSTKPLSRKFLNNIKRPLVGLPIGKKFEKTSNRIHQRYKFLSRPLDTRFGKIDENTFGGIISIDPEFENYFSGILGLGRNNKRLSFNGEIDIHLENVIERAGSYGIYWKKIDSLSQKIYLEITQPHLPIFNLGFYWKFQNELFPKLYNLNTHEIRTQYYNSYFNNLGIGYTYSVTSPTIQGSALGYQQVKAKSLTLVFNNKTIDNRVLPTEGFQYELKINRGIQNNSDFIENEFDIESYFPIYNQYNLKLSSISRMIWSNNRIPKARYVFFGGASTLRGYQENQFSSSDFQIISADIGFNNKNKFRSSIFIDHGFTLNHNSKFRKTSLGVGIIQINDESIIEIQYGMPLDKTISDGKIHIKFISRF